MRHLVCIAFCLISILAPLLSVAKELERGQVTFRVENETLRITSGSFSDTQNETDLIIDLWQDTIDWGTIVVNAMATLYEGDWSAGSYSLKFRDYWVSPKTKSDITFGDHTFMFRAFEDFFLNYQVPAAFMMGVATEFFGDRWKAAFFGGKVLARIGIIGNAYRLTDQYLFGTNFGVHLARGSFIGGGYIGTIDRDAGINPSNTRKNNIFLADVRLGILDTETTLNLTGEYFNSLYTAPERSGWTSAYSLILGPIFQNKKGSFQANYRNLKRDFRFISRYYPVATNQQGVFAYGQAQILPQSKITAYGSADFYWDDPLPIQNRNPLYTSVNNLGLTYYPTQNLYLLFNTSVVYRTASGANPAGELLLDFSGGVSTYFLRKTLNPYLRFRYSENRTDNPFVNTEREPEGILGVRWDVSRRLQMEFRSNVRNLADTMGLRDELTTDITYLLNWRPLNRIYLNPSVEYTRVDDNLHDVSKNTITLGLGYGQEFHHGWRINLATRWSKGWGQYDDSYLDVMAGVEKSFNWGRPILRKGVPKPGLPLVSGDIVGYVFIDENGNLKREPWEKGIAEIPVYMDGRFAAVTDMSGRYAFENALIGEHTVTLDARELPIEYQPQAFRKKVKVAIRSTEEADFPTRFEGSNSESLRMRSPMLGSASNLRH